MSQFVLVRHDNGIVSPVSAAIAARKGFEVVEGPAVDLRGRPVRPVRDNGRPVKPRTTVAVEAAKKSSEHEPDVDATEQAVTPDEGAAESTLTESKE